MKRSITKIACIIGLSLLLGAWAWAGDGQIDIAEIPYAISSSGSYIVVDDLSTTATDIDGIIIDADNVTLDLNGHAIIGPGKVEGTTGHGIFVNGTKYNIAIRNGTVRDWRQTGVNGDYAYNSQFEALRCYNNGSRGIIAGPGSTVSGNTCYENTYDGIYASHGCAISGNVCMSNGDDGIDAGEGCSISGNACRSNGADGIEAEERCAVIGNACQFNTIHGISVLAGGTVTGNSCGSNGYYGINTGGSMVSGNNCSFNTGDGIQVSYDCRVVDNACGSNGFSTGDGAGIHTTSSDNCIERNLVNDNDRGIDCNPATGNYIASNRASGNGINYDIVGGNTVGAGDLLNVSF